MQSSTSIPQLGGGVAPACVRPARVSCGPRRASSQPTPKATTPVDAHPAADFELSVSNPTFARRGNCPKALGSLLHVWLHRLTFLGALVLLLSCWDRAPGEQPRVVLGLAGRQPGTHRAGRLGGRGCFGTCKPNGCGKGLASDPKRQALIAVQRIGTEK